MNGPARQRDPDEDPFLAAFLDCINAYVRWLGDLWVRNGSRISSGLDRIRRGRGRRS